jgi:replicative DNA helicase
MTAAEKVRQLDDLDKELARVVIRLRQLKDALKSSIEARPNGYQSASDHPRESGALRRATMDLTRALAEYRKTPAG